MIVRLRRVSAYSASVEGPAYAIDDETAIEVTDGNVNANP
jgi:hypothetical protein